MDISIKLKTITEINSEIEALLQSHWPNSTKDFYKDLVDLEKNEGQVCFVLERENTEIIGFARLRNTVQKCFTSGKIGILSYVVVAEKYRGQGFGLKLLELIEREVRRSTRKFGRPDKSSGQVIITPKNESLSFHYIYLECDAEKLGKFYEKRGYRKTYEGVTASSKVMKNRDISRIEHLFLSKQTVTTNKIWMRKRILTRFCVEKIDGKIIQIGPCCGLAALFIAVNHQSKNGLENHYLKFLCEEIFRELKYTGLSFDGEIFDAKKFTDFINHDLKEIFSIDYTDFYIIIDASVVDISDAFKDINFTNQYLLVPFDCDLNNSPGKFNGLKSHWGVITGRQEDDDDDHYILKHGKTKTNILVTKEKLIESNLQLNEFDERINILSNEPQSKITEVSSRPSQNNLAAFHTPSNFRLNSGSFNLKGLCIKLTIKTIAYGKGVDY